MQQSWWWLASWVGGSSKACPYLEQDEILCLIVIIFGYRALELSKIHTHTLYQRVNWLARPGKYFRTSLKKTRNATCNLKNFPPNKMMLLRSLNLTNRRRGWVKVVRNEGGSRGFVVPQQWLVVKHGISRMTIWNHLDIFDINQHTHRLIDGWMG